MKVTQYKIHHVTEQGNKYEVVFINDENLELGQVVHFNEKVEDFYIDRKYGTSELEEIDEENRNYHVYTLISVL